jgi:uncharacterized membrane protein
MRHTDVKTGSFRDGAISIHRWDAIDVARGLAIMAMILYHFSWDLSFLQLIGTNILQVPAWRWFARGIAGSFLMLAGFGLVLAHAGGFRTRPFLRRLLKVGGAAIAVTVATYFAFPESYIFFGILHSIAATSVLALPFLRLPPALTLAAAVFCLAGPHVFTSPALDAPLLDWLGLGSTDPVTNDYVPIFPWLGLVLIGVAAGRIASRWQETMSLARWRAKDRLSRLLIWAGRKSLPIYLTHQIILLGLLYGVLQIIGPSPSAACRQTCLMQNGNPALCPSVCSCILQQVPERDLWGRLLANRAAAEDTIRISRAAQQCMRQNPPS